MSKTNEYDRNELIQISYMYSDNKSDEGLERIKQRVKIPFSDDDFKQCIKILQWTFYNLLYETYDGDYNNEFSLDIIEYVKTNKVRVNCLCHAIVMNEILLAYGFKSRKVYCFGKEIEPENNHVLVETFIQSLNKWVAFDPTANTYFLYENSNPLSIAELRNIFYKNMKPKIVYAIKIKTQGLKQVLDYKESNYINYLKNNMDKFLMCSSQHTKFLKTEEQFFLLVAKNEFIGIKEILWNTGKKCKAKVIKNEIRFWS